MESDEEMTDAGSEIRLMSREWERIQQSRFKEGFVTGSLVGQEQSLQSAFNAGFKQGFLSNYILSKIRGILRALLAYQAAYEGNPITDGILLEAHGLLEEISSLEANAVAEEFLKMSLNNNAHPQANSGLANSLAQEFSSARITCAIENEGHRHGDAHSSRRGSSHTEGSGRAAHGLMDSNSEFPINSLSVNDVNAILLQCPPILSTVNKCKSILKSLNWTDEMIDRLL